jgi:hypothetical protein
MLFPRNPAKGAGLPGHKLAFWAGKRIAKVKMGKGRWCFDFVFRFRYNSS